MSFSSSPSKRFMEASIRSIVGEVEVDSEAEVVALSSETLLATSSFVCEVCGKEFRRDQNLQIHRRGHNLLWSFSAKKAPSDVSEVVRARRRVYVCPEPSCVHHDPVMIAPPILAMGALTVKS
ncbi:hypothetical protein Cni_G19300 [Canna indica]|uniref:C2H2-type domain-containing protein n=1 Tax=Canna indica TaxID=4628 RepID=A0AAQ3KKG5_9LILI|nr:hypothetical protein Cni_G19300 [Canna indica]